MRTKYQVQSTKFTLMIRRVIVAIVGLALRIYFQRIEVTGVEHVPLNTPVIFVLNHPNALVDPVFLFSLAPRPVSLWNMEPRDLGEGFGRVPKRSFLSPPGGTREARGEPCIDRGCARAAPGAGIGLSEARRAASLRRLTRPIRRY